MAAANLPALSLIGETMNCPRCLQTLDRCRYEGLPVFVCRACDGYLIRTHHVGSIKARRDKSTDELEDEAVGVAPQRFSDGLTCPRCLREMRPEPAPGPIDFHLDECRSCDIVWFDGGELARVQIHYEGSAGGRDMAELRERFHNMPAERRAEFERNLAALPPGDASLTSPFGEGLLESLRLFSGRWSW
jgi:Zn-finger nucleic acid-binding protein